MTATTGTAIDYRDFTIVLTRSTLHGVRCWHFFVRHGSALVHEGWHTGVREQVIREAKKAADEHAAKGTN